MRILLVEDEPQAALMLAKGLREQAFAVDVAADGAAAIARALDTSYDAIVLDVMLPGVDGLAVCRRLRAHGARTPILMLTALDAVESRIQGLDGGADDYLTKPFDFGELLARLRAIIRRGSRPIAPDVVSVGDIAIDTTTRRVTRSGLDVPLTAREYALLEFFARRAGAVVSREEIADRVWDERHDPASNVIEVFIQRLRRKLDRPGEPSVIATRRGQGYLFG